MLRPSHLVSEVPQRRHYKSIAQTNDHEAEEGRAERPLPFAFRSGYLMPKICVAIAVVWLMLTEIQSHRDSKKRSFFRSRSS